VIRHEGRYLLRTNLTVGDTRYTQPQPELRLLLDLTQAPCPDNRRRESSPPRSLPRPLFSEDISSQRLICRDPQP